MEFAPSVALKITLYQLYSPSAMTSWGCTEYQRCLHLEWPTQSSAIHEIHG